MKYFIGRVEVRDSSRDHMHFVCIVERSADNAKVHLERLAQAAWGSKNGQPTASGWFSHDDGAYLSRAGDVNELTPAAFQALAAVHPVLGYPVTGDLSEEAPDERAKTLARRLGDQLEKLGTKVSYNKLLNAVAASMGETDYAVLKHKQTARPVDKPTDEKWYPQGNWPKTSPRKIDEVKFGDRVDAVWLTNGDVRLAAKLLHVDPEDLMGSFNAGEADVAFCSRPDNWKPEDSLAGNFGRRSEKGRSFEVRVERFTGSYAQVEGFVRGRSVVAMNNNIQGQWHIGASSCLPSNFEEAQLFLACYEAVMQESIEQRNRSMALEDEPEFPVTGCGQIEPEQRYCLAVSQSDALKGAEQSKIPERMRLALLRENAVSLGIKLCEEDESLLQVVVPARLEYLVPGERSVRNVQFVANEALLSLNKHQLQALLNRDPRMATKLWLVMAKLSEQLDPVLASCMNDNRGTPVNVHVKHEDLKLWASLRYPAL